MPLTVDSIVAATGCRRSNIEANWPLIVSALDAAGIRSDLVEIAAAATVATETPFSPIEEKMARPERQPELAALQARYFPWIGRGFIQITHEQNYRLYSSLTGVDLIADPKKACDPAVAAMVLAQYFKRNGVDKAANSQDWRKVRRLVNGGYMGWEKFDPIVRSLQEVLGV